MPSSEGCGKLIREAYWREQIAACESSGLTIAEYCRRRKISMPMYHWWKRTLKHRDGVVASTPMFEELRLAGRPAITASLIEVALAGGRRILVHPGFDAVTLAEVVRTLEGVMTPGPHVSMSIL